MQTIQFGSPNDRSYWTDSIDNKDNAADGDCGGNSAMGNENNQNKMVVALTICLVASGEKCINCVESEKNDNLLCVCYNTTKYGE